MKKFTLITLSIFTMLVSCKCKKAVAEAESNSELAIQNTNANIQETKNVNETTIKEVDAAKIQSSKQENELIAEYEANTRGYFMKVKYANNQLGYTKERDSQKLTLVTLSKAQVEELNGLLLSIKFETLPNLKDPTQKRFYDGAAIAYLKISKDGNEYKTDEFDHGFPPAEIEKLVKKLVSYTEQK